MVNRYLSKVASTSSREDPSRLQRLAVGLTTAGSAAGGFFAASIGADVLAKHHNNKFLRHAVSELERLPNPKSSSSVDKSIRAQIVEKLKRDASALAGRNRKIKVIGSAFGGALGASLAYNKLSGKRNE